MLDGQPQGLERSLNRLATLGCNSAEILAAGWSEEEMQTVIQA